VRSTLDELTKELNELKALVASITPVNSVLAGHQDSLIQQYVVIRRRFDYAAFAVALYASFEKFIENLVVASARLETQRIAYADLPKKFQTRHLAKTAEILWRGRLGEGRYAGLTELEVVRNLYLCLSGASPYELNEAAVVAHDQNLRADEVDKVFAAVGIEGICAQVRRVDALLDWYCEAQQLDARPEDVPEATVAERLGDIVERRNQVAHRGGNPNDLLGADGMRDAIHFIDAFSRSIFAISVSRYLQATHAAPGQAIQLTQRLKDGPYKAGTVVVVNSPTHRLFVGQPVFVIVDTAGARWGRIQSIKVNDSYVQAVEANTAARDGVGLGLDFKCPRGATLVALAADDDLVWSPPAA